MKKALAHTQRRSPYRWRPKPKHNFKIVLILRILRFFFKDKNKPNNTKLRVQKQKILRRGGKKTQKNYTKKIFTTEIIMMVCSLT